MTYMDRFLEEAIGYLRSINGYEYPAKNAYSAYLNVLIGTLKQRESYNKYLKNRVKKLKLENEFYKKNS